MNKVPTKMDTFRSVLTLVLVFFVAIIFSGLIYGSVITILFYFFQRYYKRSKELEKQLADLTSGKMQPAAGVPPPSVIPPPPSTDA